MWRRILGSPWLPLALAAVVVVLGLPSLQHPVEGDDYLQRVWLLGPERLPTLAPALFHSHPVRDLHVVFTPAANSAQMDVGILPWWTDPDLRVACLRWLAALTQWLDYRLWPDTPAFMHLHSLLWAALIAVAATLLYRQLLGPTSTAAGLAACLFAVDSSHGLSTYVWAYRNGLLALLFGILTLLAHARHRAHRGTAAAALAPALLAASLLSSEVGVATVAYLVAYAACLDRGPVRERALSLLPYAPILIGWQLLCVVYGYGLNASGTYFNPAVEPIRFLASVGHRLPMYLLGQWVDLDVMMSLTGAGRRLWFAGAAASALVAIVAFPLLRGDRGARFWALGMVLSALPVCVLELEARRLLFASLGGAGLLAKFLEAAASATSRSRVWRGVTVLVGAALVASRLILGPVVLYAKARPYRVPSALVLELAPDAARQTVVVLNPLSALALYIIPHANAVEGRVVPYRLRGLAASAASGTAARTDDRTLAVKVRGGYLTTPADTVFRAPRRRMTPGERVHLPGLDVEVVSVKEDGRPWEVRFRFDVPLEDSSLRWLQWNGREYAPLQPPAVGDTVEFTPAGVTPVRAPSGPSTDRGSRRRRSR